MVSPYGSASTNSRRPADDRSTAHPAPSTSDTRDATIDEEPRTGLDHEEVVEWTRYEQISEQRLRFFFPTGTPTCYGSRVVVEEDASIIEVAVIVGTVPDVPENCAVIGRIASILVTTDAPVEERAIIHLDASEALT